MRRYGHAAAGIAFLAGGVYLYGEGMLNGVEDFSKPEETQTTETLAYMAGSAALFLMAGKEGLRYVDMGKERELEQKNTLEKCNVIGRGDRT